MSHPTPSWEDAIDSAEAIDAVTAQSRLAHEQRLRRTDEGQGLIRTTPRLTEGDHGLKEMWGNEACKRVFTAFLRQQRGDSFANWCVGQLNSYMTTKKFPNKTNEDQIREQLHKFRLELEKLVQDPKRYQDLQSRVYNQRRAGRAANAAREEAVGDVGQAYGALAELQVYWREFGNLIDQMILLDGTLKWSTDRLKGAKRKGKLDGLGIGWRKVGESLGELKAAIDKWKELKEGQYSFPKGEELAYEAVEEAAKVTYGLIVELQTLARKVGNSMWSYAAALAHTAYRNNIDYYDEALAQKQQVANAVTGALQTALGSLAVLFPPLAAGAVGISALTFVANQASTSVAASKALRRDPNLVGKVLTTKLSQDKTTEKVNQMMYLGKWGGTYGDKGEQIGNVNSALTNVQNVSTVLDAATTGTAQSVFHGAASALGSVPAAPVGPLLSLVGQSLQVMRNTPKTAQTMPGAKEFIGALDAIRTGAGVTEDQVIFKGVTDDDMYAVTVGGEDLTFDPDTYQIYNLKKTWATLSQQLQLAERSIVWEGTLPNQLTKEDYPVSVRATVYPSLPPKQLVWNAAGSFLSALVSVTLEVWVNEWKNGEYLPIDDPRLGGHDFDWWATLDTQGVLRLTDMTWIGSALPTIPTEFLCRTLRTLEDVLGNEVLLDEDRNVFLFYQCAELVKSSDGTYLDHINRSYPEDEPYFTEWLTAAQAKLNKSESGRSYNDDY